MQIEMLKSKLHQARVTDGNVMYEGSLGIDAELMKAVGLYRYEKILVANINTGSRLETYAIPEEFGSKRIVLNGAAARLGAIGDRIIIMSYCWVEDEEVREGRFQPSILRLNEDNVPVASLSDNGKRNQVASMLGY